jgi:lipopolysaccharide/colanic/teichoic acid biosynthesis glycosyltransferase
MIAASSGFPVLFFQQRIGLHGSPFKILKFRTMRHSDAFSKGSFHAGDSSRVTIIGRILRKTKLDELPQLFNVLKGDMSFVGPRPEVPQWVAAYPGRWEKVYRVRPGITDNASILYRGEEAILAATENPEEHYRSEILPRKLDLYERYVEDNSLAGDLEILLKTFWSLLFVNKS